jgi:hypothetical protein
MERRLSPGSTRLVATALRRASVKSETVGVLVMKINSRRVAQLLSGQPVAIRLSEFRHGASQWL